MSKHDDEIEFDISNIAIIFNAALKANIVWSNLASYIHDEALDPSTRAWMCGRALSNKGYLTYDQQDECRKEILKCLSDELQCIKKAKKPPLHPPRPSSTSDDKYKWFDTDGK